MLDKQHSLHKLHANYGRVFSEWSALEREMGDGLQVINFKLFCPQSNRESDFSLISFSEFLTGCY